MRKGDSADGEAKGANHAQLMDRVYRHQRHIYDLTRKYYLLGRDQLVRELDAKPGERVVEVGCGTARNLIRIARAYPQAQLYGLDASSEMLRTAEESIARAGLTERIHIRHGFAEEMTSSLFGMTESFDHAVFSYSLSMIPDWRGALGAASQCLRPEGTTHIVDFGDLNGLWSPLGRALRAWLRLFHVAPRDELLAVMEGSQKDPRCALRILPGRYAFVFHARPDAIAQLLSSDGSPRTNRWRVTGI